MRVAVFTTRSAGIGMASGVIFSNGTSAVGCGTGELRPRFRLIVPAVLFSATTVP